MKTRWKVLIGLGVVLAGLLTINTIVVDQDTDAAEVTVEGGQLISLPGGEIQVVDRQPQTSRPGAPIVLIHCYACSLRWWDEAAALLAERHRVIQVDLLGFGGSEKPSSGYGISHQAQLVGGALNQLDVDGAVVVGQAMGTSVAVALAEQSSQLVDRVVAMSHGVDNDSSSRPLLARLGYVPVIGQAMYRLTPDFAVRSAFKDAFAPEYDVSDEFEDVIVDDYRAMTYTAYDEASGALSDYRDEAPLDERIRMAAVPLMVVVGTDDQILEDPPEAAEAWRDVPGARITTMPGVGHTPQVEAPQETVDLIEEFAADAGDEALGERPPRNVGRKKGK